MDVLKGGVSPDGGFIEALTMDDQVRKKYLRESLLERVVFVDIPQKVGFGIR